MVMPAQEAAVPPQKPSILPENVLTMLDGTGKKMSVANSPITKPAAMLGDIEASSQAVICDSAASPNHRNGRMGTAKTTAISNIQRNRDRFSELKMVSVVLAMGAGIRGEGRG
jgi:hypothetical protein